MANYLIVAQEEEYRGEHGVENWTIEDCADAQEAFAIAREMSLDLIDSYDEFYDSFKENAEYWADQEEEDGKFLSAEAREEYIANAIEEQREDAMYCMCWKLSDKFDYSSLNKEDIDWRDIVDIYGEEEY